jgi:hypothetical protein
MAEKDKWSNDVVTLEVGDEIVKLGGYVFVNNCSLLEDVVILIGAVELIKEEVLFDIGLTKIEDIFDNEFSE